MALVGADAAASRLRELLGAAGIGIDGLSRNRGGRQPGARRHRTQQQVARIDYELDTDADDEVQRAIAAQVTLLAAGAKAWLVSDYLKGAVTRSVIEALLHDGSKDGVAANGRTPLIVDPKIPHLPYYEGATIVTLNRSRSGDAPASACTRGSAGGTRRQAACAM